MERDGAIRMVADEHQLEDRLASVWLDDNDVDEAQVARRFIETRRGATRRQLDLLRSLLV
jgi:3-deoxy-D-manno-octulosonic-acid transferase